MSRRKQPNPKSLRNSIDSVTDLLNGESKLNEQNCIGSSMAPQEALASVFLKNMTNQSDFSESRKLYQLAKLTLEYFENAAKDIKKEPVVQIEEEQQVKSRSRSSSRYSTNSDTNIDVTTVAEPTQPIVESKKPQRKRFTYNSQNEIQNTNSIVINGKRYYPLKFPCENCGLRYSDQSTLDTHKQNYCTKRNQSKTSSTDSSSSSSSSSDESSSSNSRSSSPINNIQNNESNSNIQLLKSVMYQCSMCTFQSDKKSAMNRHSRIHLPQKRKQMEESTNGKITETIDNDINDKQKSYCKECDIHFSSIKTFLHHRNNYCQKYKTIESVMPIQVTLPETIKKPQPITPQLPSQPILMGDLLYFPVYKINESKNEPQVSKPIDLSVSKSQVEEADTNLPLDLSLKKTESKGFHPVGKSSSSNFSLVNSLNLPQYQNKLVTNENQINETKILLETEEIKKNSNSPISSNFTNSIIQHHLVKKTLIDLYGDNFELFNINDEIEEISSNSIKANGITKIFYMCTACGYRGNTSRGVKQHGKLHLNQDENFSIINVTDTQPYLVYSSLSDGDLRKLTIGKRDLTESLDDNLKVYQMSKKARLLDYNFKSDLLGDINNNVNKSQTYCQKCDIQFQHINNFLAHKKSYCKD